MRFVSLFLLLVSACSTSSEEGLTTFEVDMSKEIGAGRFAVASDSVGVRGSISPLSWGTTLIAQDPDGDSVYVVNVALPVSPEPARYKFKVERGDPSEGWESGRDRLIARTTTGARVHRYFNQLPPGDSSKVTGRVDTHPAVASRFLDNARDVWVYLPPTYPDSEDRYPVLYLQDGHAVFDSRETGFEWGADETAEALIAAGAIEPIIIVGISASPARMSEYTPTVGRESASGGKGPEYIRFLVEELKPFIDGEYRTVPGRAAVGGSSLGGLISIYAGLVQPEVFEGVLAASPSVWWDGESILALARESEAASPRIWVEVGDEEGARMVSGAVALAKVLESRPDSIEVHLQIAMGAGHHELAWAARFPDMLRFLYGR